MVGRSRREPGGPVWAAAWPSLPLAEAFTLLLQSDDSQGLTPAEASRRLGQFGYNLSAAPQQRSTISIFLAQFQSLVVALLVGTTVVGEKKTADLKKKSAADRANRDELCYSSAEARQDIQKTTQSAGDDLEKAFQDASREM